MVDVSDRASVNAKAEPPSDAVSNRLPVMGHILGPVVAMVAKSVGLTTGAGVVVVGGPSGGMTMAAWGLERISD